ncbi:MAG: hypothetical protein ACJAZS_000340 [Alteromonas naphthalenivorans]|jgi:hypothetical protein
MNKKSLFLTLLLFGGLLIPQETKPAELIVPIMSLGAMTAFYGFVALDTARFFEHNHLKQYGITKQDDIKEYKAHIQLYNKQGVFFKTLLVEENPEMFFLKITQSTDPFREEKNIFLEIDCSIVSKKNNQEHALKKITIKRFSKTKRNHRNNTALLHKLKKCFLIKQKHPRSFIDNAARGAFLIAGGGYLVITYEFIFYAFVWGFR